MTNKDVSIQEQKELEIQGQSKNEKVENVMNENLAVFKNEKATKKQKFGAIVGLLSENLDENALAIDFIENEINLLNKKNRHKSKKDVARENERLEQAEKIVALFDENKNKPMTLLYVGQEIGLSVETGELTTQKVSSLIKLAVEELGADITKKEKAKPVAYILVDETQAESENDGEQA